MSASERTLSVRLDLLIGDYKNKAGQAAQATTQIGDAGEKAGSRAAAALGATTKAVGAVTAAALVGGAALLKNAMQTGVAYNQLEQTARISYKTILGSAEAAAQMMEQVAAFAKTSPFPRQAFIQGTQQLLSFGMQAEKVIPTLSAIQDAVAASGGGSQDINEIVSVLAKVTSTGKITAVTLNELGLRGIDAAKLIGDGMGKTASQIRSSVTKGTLDAGEAIDVLVAQMSKSFAGAAAGVKDTWVGSTDRIKGAWRDISSIIAEPFVHKAGGGLALDWANSLADALRAAEAKTGPLVAVMMDRLKPAFDQVLPAIHRMKDGINSFDVSKVDGQLDALAQNGPVLGAITAAIIAMGTQIPILQKLGLAVNPLAAGMVALIALSPELRSAFGDFAAALAPLLPIAQQTGQALISTATAILVTLAPALRDLLLAVAPVIVQFGQGLGTAAVSVIRALVPVAQVVADVASAVSKLPTPVLAAALAFAAVVALRGPLSAMLSTTGAAFSGLNATMATSRAVAAETGGAISVMSVTSAMAGTSIAALGTAMKVAFMSNPIGMVIAGIGLALGGLAMYQSEAASKTEGHKAAVQSLTEALKASNGAMDDSVQKILAQQLADEKGKHTKLDMITLSKQLGLSQGEMTKAILEGGAAFDVMRAKIKGIAEANRTAGYGGSGYYTDVGKAALDALDGIDKFSGATNEAVEGQKNLNWETKGSKSAIESETAALEANISKKQEAAGATLSQAQAELRYAETKKRSMEQITQAADMWNVETQSLNVNTDEQKKNASALLETATSARQVIDAQQKNNVSGTALRKTVDGLRSDFIAQAEAAGIGTVEAGKLADAYGLIPKEVVSDVKLQSEAAMTQLNDLHKAIQATPDKTVTIDEPASPAIVKGLELLGYKVEHLPNGQIKVTETGAVETGDKIDGVASKKRLAEIIAQAQTETAENWLNNLARPRYTSITVDERISTGKGGAGGLTGNAAGARLPKSSTGRRLPLSGPGTDVVDGILGVGRDGIPTSWVDKGEWIINGRSSEKYDRELAAINAGTFPQGGLNMSFAAPIRMPSGSSGIDSAALDRLTEAVHAARSINFNAPDTSRGSFMGFVREMEGV
ncbi:tape measure protein [Arthrobacter sp. GMC3]|uniref:tape measure protein n=1 Tax=Arthrobacter sp. GMC3 TaxID=2058894 RepID=UPI000CE3ABCC|nr:tape measure protein [Arthrobacter sp. GMC3]